jgi:hypothetical protein
MRRKGIVGARHLPAMATHAARVRPDCESSGDSEVSRRMQIPNQ